MYQNLKTLRRETTALGTPEVDGNPGDNSLCYQSKFLAIFLAGEVNFLAGEKNSSPEDTGEKLFSPARKIAARKMWREK